MTINSELTSISTTASNIKTEITNKGQTVSSSDTWADLPAKIKQIENYGHHITVQEVIDGSVENIEDDTLKYIRPNCFRGCINLETAKFSTISKICRLAFCGCHKLKALILSGSTMVKLDSIDAFRYTMIEAGTGNIYVTDSLLATYRADSIWKHYYNNILPLSSYYSENCDIPYEYYSVQQVSELPTNNIAKYCLYNKQTNAVTLNNKSQFVAGDSVCLDELTIKAGTTWNVKIDNTSGWYDSTETELTTNYTFAHDVKIVINQVYPLNTSYMFSEAGDTNIVVLSAAPTEEICETDGILKFVDVNSVTDWTNSTHITLNKIEIGMQTSSTEGWTNYQNAFDSNDSTYATCGTATDYLQIQYDLPVYVAGFNAICNFASSVARACNLSLSTYDTDTEVLIANGIGGAETETYTTSATFDDTYMRTLRFKLTNTTAGTAPTTNYPTRVKTINLAVDPDSKIRIKDLTDGQKDVITSYENRTGTWKKVTDTVLPEDYSTHELTHQNYYFNKTFNGNLYQCLDYMVTPNAVNIDTGIKANSNLKMIFDFIPRVTTGAVLLGHNDTGDSSDYRFFNYSNAIYFDIGSGRINGGSCAPGNRYKFEFGNYYVKNYMDTTNIITGSAQTYSSDVTIKIRQALDFYSLKIFKNGILIGDFYPCYNIQNSTIGIYNVLTKTFYSNTSTGVMSKGNDSRNNIYV